MRVMTLFKKVACNMLFIRVYSVLLCALCPPPGCAWEWDNLTCWQAASVGEVVVVSCPELFEFMSPEEGERFILLVCVRWFVVFSSYHRIRSSVGICVSD